MNTYKILKQSTEAVRATLRSVRHQVPALALAGVASLSLFSACMDDATLSSGYTQEQLDNSPKGKTGAFWAIPARMTLLSTTHTNFGWGTIIHVRDLLTGDLTNDDNNYNAWWNWQYAVGLGQDPIYTDYVYTTYYNTILAANICIRTYTAGEVSNGEKGYLGAAYAYRAMSYLDLARMYEFLPNEKFPDGLNSQGNVVTNLTVPIVTDKLTKEQSYNNPRATHAQMVEFILSDLDKAEANIADFGENSKDVPHLDVVYGLKARTYLWDGQYDKAAEYARKAITARNGSPLTQAQWLDVKSGFNNPGNGSWMMSVTLNTETLGSNNLCNWTAFLSSEALYGYTGQGEIYPEIDSLLYSKIADTDFRKLSFKAPKGGALEGKTPYINAAYGRRLPAFASVKFRPGDGDMKNFKVAAACSYPLMRLEEMYLIEAEAVAHGNPTQGQSLINTFMQTYRDKNYNCTLTDADALVNEIVLQKRIELWGEGQAFFDIKRLNLSVTRYYPHTNHDPGTRFNTNGRPAWMNFVLPKFEGTFNTPVFNYNNPDPSGKYKSL